MGRRGKAPGANWVRFAQPDLEIDRAIGGFVDPVGPRDEPARVESVHQCKYGLDSDGFDPAEAYAIKRSPGERDLKVGPFRMLVF